MAWTWRLEGSDPSAYAEIEVPVFDSQSDAESWVGDEWQLLLDGGVDAVTLLDGDSVVYANMSLHPPD